VLDPAFQVADCAPGDSGSFSQPFLGQAGLAAGVAQALREGAWLLVRAHRVGFLFSSVPSDARPCLVAPLANISIAQGTKLTSQRCRPRE
jgi:hypothetical protein